MSIIIKLTWHAHTSPNPPFPSTRYMRKVLYVTCWASNHFHWRYLNRTKKKQQHREWELRFSPCTARTTNSLDSYSLYARMSVRVCLPLVKCDLNAILKTCSRLKRIGYASKIENWLPYLWKYIDDSNSLNGSPARNDLTAVTHGSKTSLLPTVKWMKQRERERERETYRKSFILKNWKWNNMIKEIIKKSKNLHTSLYELFLMTTFFLFDHLYFLL